MPGMTICIDPDAMPSWDVPAHSDAAPPVPSPHTLPSSSCNSPGENHRILTPGGDFSSSTTNCNASSPMLPLLSCISPGENRHMLMPGPDDLDSSHTAPSLRRSNHSCTPSSRLAMDDGLLPSHRLSEAISDSTSAAAHKHSSWTSKRSPLSNEISDQLLTVAFLSEFSPFRESHSLIPLDLSDLSPYSLNGALAAIADGSLEPLLDDDDNPKWAEAMASPECEFWIAGAQDELRSLEDLKVFVLVPQSSVPKGKRLLKGRLVCK
jgi:hypothetical protein